MVLDSAIHMHYHHTFIVKAPLEKVAAFHRQSSSMGAITPPPVVVQVHQAPALLNDGDEMDFTLWLGPLPIRWLARIEQPSPTGFVDRLIQGPFTAWVHTHTFRSIDPTTTEVIDAIAITPSAKLFWKVVGYGMWLNLPILFAFRAWKTKRILEETHSVQATLATPPV